MVSSMSITFLDVQILLALGVPLLIFFWQRRQERLALRPVFVGAVIFFLFSQVLEKALWQALHFNIFMVEALLLGVAAISVIFIKRSRAMFESLEG